MGYLKNEGLIRHHNDYFFPEEKRVLIKRIKFLNLKEKY